ncbi:MAG: EF-hand domain-containing protein [Acidobacteriota bacterium]
MKASLGIVPGLAVTAGLSMATAGSAQQTLSFADVLRQMDRNSDNRISITEWKGDSLARSGSTTLAQSKSVVMCARVLLWSTQPRDRTTWAPEPHVTAGAPRPWPSGSGRQQGV